MVCGERKVALLGLLENSGRYFERKSEALREAQKNPDIERVISNLRNVKSLENNLPNFLPPEDHGVADHTLAIVLQKKEEYV